MIAVIDIRHLLDFGPCTTGIDGFRKVFGNVDSVRINSDNLRRAADAQVDLGWMMLILGHYNKLRGQALQQYHSLFLNIRSLRHAICSGMTCRCNEIWQKLCANELAVHHSLTDWTPYEFALNQVETIVDISN